MSKKEKLIDELSAIISAFSKAEISIAKKHILAYRSSSIEGNKKMYQLFNQLEGKSNWKFNDLKIKVSEGISDKGFQQLLRRTIERVRESLILDVNIARDGVYSLVFFKQFQLKKMLMQGHILQSRALAETALGVYNKIISVARKYELYDELIEAIILKQSLVANMKGSSTFKRLKKSLELAEISRNYLRDTKVIYATYSVALRTNSLSSSQKDKLAKKLRIIKTYYEQTDSKNIYTQFLLIQMELFANENQFKAAILNGKTLIRVLNENQAVYSKPRIAFVYIKITDSLINLLDFGGALISASEGISWVNQKSINEVIYRIHQSDSHFFLENYSTSLEIINGTLSFSILEKYGFHLARLQFMKSINHFILKDYRGANELLVDLNEIERDKEGWNFWIRVMRILCSLELSKLNLLDYSIESLRKHVGRVRKVKEGVNPRSRLVLKFLSELSKNGVNFQLTANKLAREFALLKSTEKGYCWEIDSPEKILFHDWFAAKLDAKEYQPNFLPYRKMLATKEE